MIERDYLVLSEIYSKYNNPNLKVNSENVVDYVLKKVLSDGLNDDYERVSDFVSELLRKNGIKLKDCNIEKIRLEYFGRFGEVPEDIGYFSNLKEFVYMAPSFAGSSNPFYRNFSDLKMFESVFLDGFEIEKISDEIVNLPNLKSLVFSKYSIDGVSDNVSGMQGLERLSATNCTRSDSAFKISPELGKLKNLKHLNLSGNWIYVLPKELLNLENLESFSISMCGFEREDESYKIIDQLTEKGIRVF
jgi:hypothetical protein